MKQIFGTALAVMILAGGVGTFVPNDTDHWGSDRYWTQLQQDG